MGDFRQDRGKRMMHKTTCAQCGKQCEVPFKPTEGRLIFCNTCFEARKSNAHVNNFRNTSRRGGDDGMHYEIKRQLDELNTKIDRILNAIEIQKNVNQTFASANPQKTSKKSALDKAKKTVKKISKKKK